MHPLIVAEYASDRAAELRREVEAHRRASRPSVSASHRALAARQAVGLSLVRVGLRVLVRPPEPVARRA